MPLSLAFRSCPCIWLASLGPVIVQMRLTSYASGQPRVEMSAPGLHEELTIEIPGFDLRGYDADHAFHRLHVVFRCPERASLLAGCDVVRLTPHGFRVHGAGDLSLPIVYVATPPAWARILQEQTP